MNEQERREFLRYSVGLLLCAGLTAIAFFAVMGLTLSRGTILWVTGALAFCQVAVQLRSFLHLSWRGNKREDLQLIVFSLMLMSIMAGGTIWIMSSLAGRMH